MLAPSSAPLVPLPRRLLFALPLLLLAPAVGAQSADSTAARPIVSDVEWGAAADGPGCGSGPSGGGGRPCVLPDPTLGSIPMEATFGGTGGGGEGMLSVTLEMGLPVLRLGGPNIAFVSAEAALGAGTGLRGGVGVAGGIVLAESQSLRLGVRAGGWAERSPMGSAYGPAVTASARIYFVRVVAGAVVAGAPVHYGRVVLEAPLAFSDMEAFPFLGIGVEARRYADTGTFAWTLSLTLGS